MMTSPRPLPPTRPSRWRLRRFWSEIPRWGRVALLVVFFGVFAIGSYYWYSAHQQTVRQQKIAELWGEFEQAANQLDEPAMLRALDALDQMTPGDKLLYNRRRALIEGEASADDPSMCVITLRRHLRQSHWKEAEREADKRLASVPKDWISLCAKVAAALTRKDRDAALKQLDALPDISKDEVPVSLDGILFGIQLFHLAERDPLLLRNYLRARVSDRLRSMVSDSDTPAVTVKLLQCYLEAFHPTEPNPPTLALAVSDVGRLIQSATKSDEIPVLIHLGQTCERLFSAYDLLLRDKAITAEQHKALRDEHQGWTRAVWQKVRERAPNEPSGYRGLALASVRDGDGKKAIELTLAGLSIAGDDAQLLGLLTVLMQSDNRSEVALTAAGQAADRDPTNIPLQLIAAEAAIAARRNDLALIACNRVYQQNPRHPVAARLEARIYLQAGKSHKAMQVFSERIGEHRLAEDDTAARWYVRSRLEAVGVGLETFLNRCQEVSLERRDPRLLAAALTGILDATFEEEWCRYAERMAARWLDARPDDLEIMRVRAALLARLAENVPPIWNDNRVHAAVTALNELKIRASDDVETSALLSWLRLKGEHNPARALSEASLLIAAEERREPISPRHLEILGAVWLANGKTAPAVRVLEAASSAAPTPTGQFALCLAYFKQGRLDEARALLERVRSSRTGPWTLSEDADYRFTVETLQRDKQ